MRTGRMLPLLGLLSFMSLATILTAAAALQVLLIDGPNNHDWKSCRPVTQDLSRNAFRDIIGRCAGTQGVTGGTSWAAMEERVQVAERDY